MQLQTSEPLYQIMLARYYEAGIGRFLSVDPASATSVNEPESWNRYAYVRNNPIAYVDPDGMVLQYADDYAKGLVEAAAAVSPDVQGVLDHFADPNTSELLLIGTGDAPDPPGEVRFGETKSAYDGDTYKGSLVKIDKKDIESKKGSKGEKVDGRTVAIHEIVGHVNEDRQKTGTQRNAISDKKAEKTAQAKTKQALGKIPIAKCPPPPLPKKVVDK